MSSKIIVNPKGTLIGKAVGLSRFVNNPLTRLICLLIWALGAISVGVLIKSFFFDPFYLQPGAESQSKSIISLAYLSLGLFLIYQPLRMFYLFKVKYPKVLIPATAKEKITKQELVNLFSVFSFQLAEATFGIFSKTKPAALLDLITAILGSPDINFIIIRLGMNKEMVLEYAKSNEITGDALTILLASLDVAEAEKHHQIEVGDVFVALCERVPSMNKLITNLNLEVADIAHVVYWHTGLIRRSLEGKRFLDEQRFHFTGGIGRDWAYGYTPLLQRIGNDLTESIRTSGLGLEVVGHQAEIEQIEEALLRQNGGNVVLVGEPGIGKRTIVLGLAKQIVEGKVDDQLEPLHIIEINTESLLSGANGAGEITDRFTSLFNEVAGAGNIIIFIENIHTILSGEGVGSINAAELLLPFLDSAGIHVIATTDIASYNQFIRTNTGLSQRLARITVAEPKASEVIRILEDVVPTIEAKTGSVVSYEAIKETAKEADKYVVDVPNPEKSIDLLDGAVAHAASERGQTIILPKDIMAFASVKYEVPAGEAEGSEKETLLNLEKVMHDRVIGQVEAVNAIAGALRRARAGVTNSKKPIGSFLFLGPTGVGKTETAKALAEAYFGSEDSMIRFDMSEYQNKEDIYRFIGSNISGEAVQGTLTTAVREHPFSLLLFDEIEKAYRDILDLFLQILDEGHVTDGFGRKVLFSNTIIICTSNAGANLIRESISGGSAYDQTKQALLNYLQQENIYRPEFINRFTQVIAFSPLSRDDIAKVAGLMIAKLQQTVQTNRGVVVQVAPDAIAYLAELGYDPQMGARPMARVIQEKLENYLAEKILSGTINKGDAITISLQDMQGN